MSHKALVTGALGHTGTFLVNLLVKKGWKVVAMDLDPNRRKNVMKKETVFSSKFKYMSIDLPGVTFIPADLTDKESLRKLFTPENRDYDVIFHPASLYDYFAELDILMKINVDGLKNLLEVIEEAYKEKAEQEGGEVKLPRFIHWSTCGVYGEPKYKKDEKGFPIPADEDTDYDPPNNYSISKREQELALKEFAKRTNLPYTIIRPAPIYGPHQTYGAFHIFYTVHKVGHMVLPILFPKRKKLMMPMIHIEDLVEAAFFLWDKEEAIGETYNIVGDSTTEEDFMEFLYQELGKQYTKVPIWFPVYKVIAKVAFSIAELYEKRAKKLGVRPRFDLPMVGYITHNYYFSNAKIKKLGFKFKYGNPFEGTRQTIRWYIDHGWFEHETWDIVRRTRNPGAEIEAESENKNATTS